MENGNHDFLHHAGADILLQAIDACIIGEDAVACAQQGAYTNTGLGDSVKRFIRESKARAMQKMKDEVFSLAEEYGAALASTPNRPNEFELELSLSVSTKGEVCIIGAEGSAMMKVSMKWNDSR